MATLIRRARTGDLDAATAVAGAAFSALATANGTEAPFAPPSRYLARNRWLIESDPDGAWVAEHEGEVVGVALAMVREDVWGLSLLVVHPRAQSGGIGQDLLAKALAYGERARGGLILASRDPRAIRLYARAGFAVEPALMAAGRPRGVAPVGGVVEGSARDTAAIDRAVRGGARVADLEVELRTGARLLLYADRGYAVVRDDFVETLAARDEEAARALLRTALAAAPGSISVQSLTARQQWAIEECVAAGLELGPDGPVLVRGEPGPLSPYLPSGPFL